MARHSELTQPRGGGVSLAAWVASGTRVLSEHSAVPFSGPPSPLMSDTRRAVEEREGWPWRGSGSSGQIWIFLTLALPRGTLKVQVFLREESCPETGSGSDSIMEGAGNRKPVNSRCRVLTPRA